MYQLHPKIFCSCYFYDLATLLNCYFYDLPRYIRQVIDPEIFCVLKLYCPATFLTREFFTSKIFSLWYFSCLVFQSFLVRSKTPGRKLTIDSKDNDTINFTFTPTFDIFQVIEIILSVTDNDRWKKIFELSVAGFYSKKIAQNWRFLSKNVLYINWYISTRNKTFYIFSINCYSGI